MTIACDVDGVLANFTTAFAPLVTKVSGIEFPDVGKPTWPTDWFWDPRVTKAHWSAAVDLIRPNRTFWLDLKAYPDAFAFLNWLSLRHEDDIYFLTDRPGRQAKWQTERWIKLHGFTATPTVILTANKAVVCEAVKADFYIDDKFENCQSVHVQCPATTCYIMERPYNKPIAGCLRGTLPGFRKLIEEAGR